jgi:NADPH-dependent F420 reductase
MKLAVLGGTGNFGRGIALRLATEHQVILGSRSAARAQQLAKEYQGLAVAHYQELNGSVTGMSNEEAISEAELVVLAIRADALETFLEDIPPTRWKDKLVLSPITRFEFTRGLFVFKPFNLNGTQVSAAEYIKHRLGESVRVVSGMQLVPASKLADLNSPLGYDVPFCGPKEAFQEVSKILSPLKGLRMLYAGPLSVSYSIESTLPLMLNIAIRNSLGEPGLRLI